MKTEIEKAELKDKILARIASDKPFRDPSIRHLTHELDQPHDTLALLVKDIEDDGMLIARRHNLNDLYFEMDATLYANSKGRNFLTEGGYTKQFKTEEKRKQSIHKKEKNQLWQKRIWNVLNTLAIIGIGIWQALETSDSKYEEERDAIQEKRILSLESKLEEIKKTTPIDTIILQSNK